MGIRRVASAAARVAARWLKGRTPIVLLAAIISVALSPSRGLTQQNLFNVQVPDTAEPFKLFFQQQLNVAATARLGTSSTTIDYGLPYNLEVGLNIFNVQIYPGGNPPEAGRCRPGILLVNGQKVFDVAERFKVGVGMQAGVSSTNATGATDFLHYNWLTTMYQPGNGEYGKFYLGGYFGNKNYLGNGNRVGFLIGAEIPIIRDRLSFQGDYISGTNNSSVAVVGFVANVYRDWQFSLGGSAESGEPERLRPGV